MEVLGEPKQKHTKTQTKEPNKQNRPETKQKPERSRREIRTTVGKGKTLREREKEKKFTPI